MNVPKLLSHPPTHFTEVSFRFLLVDTARLEASVVRMMPRFKEWSRLVCVAAARNANQCGLLNSNDPGGTGVVRSMMFDDLSRIFRQNA